MDNTTAIIISVIVFLFGMVISVRLLQCIWNHVLEMRACVTYRALEILYPEVKSSENHLNDLSNNGE